MILFRQLKKHSIIMERTFMQNLNSRDTHDGFKGKKRPKYEGHLLSRDLHLPGFDIPADSKRKMKEDDTKVILFHFILHPRSRSQNQSHPHPRSIRV